MRGATEFIVEIFGILLVFVIVAVFSVWAWMTAGSAIIRSESDVSSVVLPEIRIAGISKSYDLVTQDLNLLIIITPRVDANTATVVLRTLTGVVATVTEGHITCEDTHCTVLASTKVSPGNYSVSIQLPDGRISDYIYSLHLG